MFLEKLNSIVSRVFFAAAFLLLIVALLERVSLFFGYTVLGQAYAPGRLLELSGVLVLFVIALLLRQIRGHAGA